MVRMLRKSESRFSSSEGSSWRAYQAKLKKAEKIAAANKRLISHLKFTPLILIAIALVYSLTFVSFGFDSVHKQDSHEIIEDSTAERQSETSVLFRKDHIHRFLDSRNFSNPKANSFQIAYDGKQLSVQTSLDISLHKYLTKKLDRKNSSKIGIVVMTPTDGRILAMVGFDKFDPQKNPCVDNTYPAASIFKIITATAAIEKANLKADSMLHFNGRKHTLYKSQLTEKETKYTNYISLKDAFAKSVNPVFGKLGALYLGKEALKSYAMAFGFNQIINFETFLLPSLTVFSDEAYQLAELASGFNKKTRITPVHGALIASTIVNKGKLIEPTIVDRIMDEKGAELYTGQSAVLGQAFNVATSTVLNELMETTIKSGTARREFRKYRKDKVISRLEIGGKTGSINNHTNDVKYDWFVGYAKEKEGDGKIAVSVLVAHEKYIGIRAAQYAMMAFKKYFINYFDNKIESSMKRTQGF
jgi:cell division protein FtsI/penicillin-binding protein 2